MDTIFALWVRAPLGDRMLSLPYFQSHRVKEYNPSQVGQALSTTKLWDTTGIMCYTH